MALETHSAFYFGHIVDGANNAIDFSEGGGELQATLDTGDYTLEEYAAEIKKQMDAIGGLVYTVVVDRTTRLISISSTATFELLVSTGSRIGTGAWALIGFTGSDRTGASTYEGDVASGQSYSTQFKLQDYVPAEHFQQSVEATVNKTATGRVEVVRFGTEQFIEMNFKFITDITQGAATPVRTRATGVQDFLDMLTEWIQKARFEFIPDEGIPGTFIKCILEEIPGSSNGTGFKLKELYDRGLPGYYESGKLKLRVVT